MGTGFLPDVLLKSWETSVQRQPAGHADSSGVNEAKEAFNLAFLPGEDHEAWAGRYYRAAAAGGRLFRNDGAGFTYIDPAAGSSKIYTPAEFYGIAHAVVKVERSLLDRDTGEWKQAPGQFSDQQIKILFASPGKEELPLLKAVVQEPVAIAFQKGGVKITRAGYNEDEQAYIYYYLPPGSQEIRPRTGTEHLIECFRGVPFERPEYRNNLIGWMLGSIVFDPFMDSPMLVVSGNQQGIGKSITVQSASHILTGSVIAPITYSGEEFSKQLGSRFRDGERIVFLDNIVTKEGRSFDNHELSSMLTQGFSKKLRVLGKSKSVSASGILFAVSLNDAKLSADLATRTLPVKLYKEARGPMVPFCKDYAIQHREELYGELLGLALQELGTWCPKISQESFRFRKWLEFVQPRIEKALGPMAIEEARSLDAATQELFALGAELLDNNEAEITSERLVQLIKFRAEAFPTLYSDLRSAPSDRGKKTKAGQFLASISKGAVYVDNETLLRLVCLTKGGKKEVARYMFEREEK